MTTLSNQTIKKLAAIYGFDLCGITPGKYFAENEAYFKAWLEKGYNSSLGYLERYLDKRFDVRRLVEGAQTVVVCAISYKNRISEGYPQEFRTRVASYACTRDYHQTIKEMLTSLLEALQQEYPEVKGRCFVDTAPLLEKRLAVEAGLGWIGRQSLLITPKFGSFVLLGELVLTLPTDEYDAPFEGSRCGRCRNCLESCPTQAIVEPKVIDTSRCISCRTIEKEIPGRTDLAGWIFGCDRCQSCCPHNQKALMHTSSRMDPLFDPLSISPEEWLSMSEEEFSARFAETPLTRSGLKRIQRNVLQNLEQQDE